MSRIILDYQTVITEQYESYADEHLIVVPLSSWLLALGSPCGLHVLEVRKDSMVLLWEPPTFNGRSAVNGYYVDIKEAGTNSWKCVHERSIQLKYKKVRK